MSQTWHQERTAADFAARRARIVALHCDGWSYRDIAAALHLPRGTVASIVRAAKARGETTDPPPDPGPSLF